jgi:uncharacterized membrane protein YciS (DUF1049 family)
VTWVLRILWDTTVPAGDWTSLLTQGGVVGVLAFIVIGFSRGWIVTGSAYREVCLQRDRAIDQVYRMADTTQRAAEIVRRESE